MTKQLNVFGQILLYHDKSFLTSSFSSYKIYSSEVDTVLIKNLKNYKNLP